MVREGRVLIASAGDPDFGASYSVQALEIGAQVTSGSSGTTITVRAGHGFAVGDKVMIGTDVTTFSATNTVASVTSTTVVMNSAYAVSAGDLLVNLAVDSSTAATPAFDGNGLTVYSDMDYSNTAANNTVSTDANGRYRYYHKGIARWELVRTGSTLISLYTDTGAASASVINVKDYGASGDGVADDTVAIQSALTAVPSTGGKVYVPAGTYIVSTSLFAKSATHLYGDGIGVAILKRKAATQTNSSTTLTGPILTAGPSVGTAYSNGTSGSKITISDMTFNCDYTNQTATLAGKGNNAIRFLYVSGLTIQRVEAINTLETAIEATFSNNVLIDSNVVSAAGKLAAVADANGIGVYYGHATAWGQNVVITHNRITDIGVSGAFASEGIATFDLDFLTITDNEIGSIINGAGIEINVTAALACVGYNISDNQIHDCTGTTGFGVAAGISGTIKGMTVSNNTISNVTLNGMYINHCSGLVVDGNSVYNSNTVVDATYFNAIDILNSDAPSCSDNVVLFGTAAAGVYGIRAFTCTNGRFSGNVVKTPTASCLILNVTTQNTLVQGNRLVGGTYGVQIANSGTNSGNAVLQNYPTGQSTAAYIDSSGQTNYMDSWTLGAFTVPGTLTLSGLIDATVTTGIQRIRSNTFYLNDGTDRDATLFFDTSTADGGLTYKGGAATNVFEFNKPFRQISAATGIYTVGTVESLVTLSTSGTTTDTSGLLPANSLILGVGARITTTITTATDWKLGDTVQAARFAAANATLTSGTTAVGLAHHDPTVATANLGPVQAAAGTFRITTTGTPGAGAIRITVYYLSFSAALS